MLEGLPTRGGVRWQSYDASDGAAAVGPPVRGVHSWLEGPRRSW